MKIRKADSNDLPELIRLNQNGFDEKQNHMTKHGFYTLVVSLCTNHLLARVLLF